jgi:soluble lytic murein transglycosylase-like protein
VVIREFVVVLLGLAGVAATVATVTALLAWRWLRRRNAVGRHRRAPVVWLWSPGRAARLHRRLGRAWYAADHAARGTASLQAPASALEARAEILDAELVALAATGGLRRSGVYREVFDRVVELEQLTARLASTARRLDALVPRIAEDPVAERLDALDAALHELSPTRPPIARR